MGNNLENYVHSDQAFRQLRTAWFALRSTGFWVPDLLLICYVNFVVLSLEIPSFMADCSAFITVFSSVAQSCLTLCNPMDLLVHRQLSEFTQTHVQWVSDAIQPSHPLLSPSPPAFRLSQHRVFYSNTVLRIRWPECWEFQLQHQSFQWTPRTDLL